MNGDDEDTTSWPLGFDPVPDPEKIPGTIQRTDAPVAEGVKVGDFTDDESEDD